MSSICWGIIGCGDIARKRVATAMQTEPRSKLRAVCRRTPEKLCEFAEQFQVPESYTTCEQLLASPDIDAVYIATPVSEHCPQAIAAAQAGKHVLLEKPMACTPEECADIIAACRQANVKLGIAYYRRFYPLLERVRQFLVNNRIGNILSISAATATPLDMQHGEEGYWRVDPTLSGGGALMDVGSHRIEVFQNLFGPIRRVKSICPPAAIAGHTETTAALLLEFKSGAIGTLECHFGTTADLDEFAIVGTRGRLTTHCLNGPELHVEIDGQNKIENHPPAENFNTPLIADFVSAILEDREPAVTGEHGLAVNEVMQQAYADARR